MSQNKVLEGGVLPKKKDRQALRKIKILETIKLSMYKPNQDLIDEAMPDIFNSESRDRKSSGGLRVI